MQLLQLFFDNFWYVVIFLFLFGGGIWTAVEWTIRRGMKHRERMQELKNEELRLKLQLAQKQEPRDPTSSTPKQVTQEEYVENLYDAGYQQQNY